jgi:hypothetical protein
MWAAADDFHLVIQFSVASQRQSKGVPFKQTETRSGRNFKTSLEVTSGGLSEKTIKMD